MDQLFIGYTCTSFGRVVNGKEGIKLKIKAYPLNDPPPFLCGLSPVLKDLPSKNSLHAAFPFDKFEYIYYFSLTNKLYNSIFY